MGKVGCVSIKNGLEPVLDAAGVPLLLAHSVNAERIEREAAWLAEQGRPMPRVIRHGRHLVEKYIPAGVDLDVVCPFREPVGRNVSAFFFNWRNWFSSVDEMRALSIKSLTDRFLERPIHDDVLTWFDEELGNGLGVDAYAQPFPLGAGWMIAEGGGVASDVAGRTSRVRVLLFRHDFSDRRKADLISWFLGVERFEIPRLHVGDEAEYGDVYKAFQREATLPEAYVERMLSSAYATHFFDEIEREAIRERWTVKGRVRGAAA